MLKPLKRTGFASNVQPPSGGCVLKLDLLTFDADKRAAAFGRLCVETDCVAMISPFPGSRLRAAVC